MIAAPRRLAPLRVRGAAVSPGRRRRRHRLRGRRRHRRRAGAAGRARAPRRECRAGGAPVQLLRRPLRGRRLTPLPRRRAHVLAARGRSSRPQTAHPGLPRVRGGRCNQSPSEATVEIRVECEPHWPLRLPGGGADGVMRTRGGVLERLLHVEEAPVVLRAAATGGGRRDDRRPGSLARPAELAIERMRFALGVDDDLAPFHARFRCDALIGRSRAAVPWLRPAAAAGALRGTRLGDLRAADRVRAGRGDRAADRARARPLAARAGTAAARRADRGGAGRRGAGAAGVLRPLPAGGRWRCGARRARSRAGGSTWAPTTTSSPGGGCGRSRGSAAGPSSAWPCTARAA